MDLTNESYLIRICGRSTMERYYRDARGWVKISSRGREFRLTAEQVLNHLLPAVAGIKPHVTVRVEHRNRRRRRPPTTKRVPPPARRGRTKGRRRSSRTESGFK